MLKINKQNKQLISWSFISRMDDIISNRRFENLKDHYWKLSWSFMKNKTKWIPIWFHHALFLSTKWLNELSDLKRQQIPYTLAASINRNQLKNVPIFFQEIKPVSVRVLPNFTEKDMTWNTCNNPEFYWTLIEFHKSSIFWNSYLWKHFSISLDLLFDKINL